MSLCMLFAWKHDLKEYQNFSAIKFTGQINKNYCLEINYEIFASDLSTSLFFKKKKKT